MAILETTFANAFYWIETFIEIKSFIELVLSLKYVPCGQIDSKPALCKIMAWRQTADKPLSEPILANFTDAYLRYSATKT